MWLNQYLKIQKSLSVDFRSTPPLFFFFPPRFYMTIIVPTDTTQASPRKSWAAKPRGRRTTTTTSLQQASRQALSFSSSGRSVGFLFLSHLFISLLFSSYWNLKIISSILICLVLFRRNYVQGLHKEELNFKSIEFLGFSFLRDLEWISKPYHGSTVKFVPIKAHFASLLFVLSSALCLLAKLNKRLNF